MLLNALVSKVVSGLTVSAAELFDAAENDAAENDANETQEPQMSKWNPDALPALYRRAEPSRVRPEFRDGLTVMATRVGFVGCAGAGKSMAMATRIKTLMPTSVKWLSATEIREASLAAARDEEGGKQAWARIRACPLLCLDDVSQANFTPAFASSLFDLLEHRNAHVLPIVWTCQTDLQALRSKIASQCGDPDQAAAISRRLGEGAKIYKV